MNGVLEIAVIVREENEEGVGDGGVIEGWYGDFWRCEEGGV